MKSKVVLVDKAGNFSNPFEFSIECTGVARNALQSSPFGGAVSENPSALDSMIKSFQSRAGHLIVAIEGSSFSSFSVEIFDLHGQRIHHSMSKASETKVLNLSEAVEERLANGVYLYFVTAKKYDGTLVHSPIKKLILLN